MITIALQRDEQQRYSGFRISGHAESADEGYDLVCAAVSVLAQTAFLGLCHYGKKPAYEQREGYFSIRLAERNETTQVILETMVLGLEEIVRQYGQYVVFDS